MKRLEETVVSLSVLVFPYFKRRVTLGNDACKVKVGYVFWQENMDIEQCQPGFGLRSLMRAERKYNITQKECTAIVWAVLLLRPYTDCLQFTIGTDQDSLTRILKLSDAYRRLRDGFYGNPNATLQCITEPVFMLKRQTHCDDYALWVSWRLIEKTIYLYETSESQRRRTRRLPRWMIAWNATLSKNRL